MTAPLRREAGLAFDRPVPLGGYRWWYIDALSDDGQHALTLIAFIGSVFSPYYARARRVTPLTANPCNHCAMNVALYSPGSRQWAMTERGIGRLSQTAASITMGPSRLHWDGATLTASIDEITAPFPSRLFGKVRITPTLLLDQAYGLDPAGQHGWRPVAPSAQVEVAFSQPALQWRGTGYLDTNAGAVPLEQDFSAWHWSRADLGDERCAVFYDVSPRGGLEKRQLSLCFEANGRVRNFAPPPEVTLPPSSWGIGRVTRSDDGNHTDVVKTLENGPFYARSLLRSHVLGQPVVAVHESLSLDRFSKPWVQALLPFRMPRRA